MKILIVDDSRVMRGLVVRTLRQAGFVGHELLEAGNGHEGLRAVSCHTPDLVLSDWDLPGMGGLELLATLRAGGNPVPFGFVTAASSPEVVARAQRAGALFVIAKPFTPESFRENLPLAGATPGPGSGRRYDADDPRSGTEADDESGVPGGPLDGVPSPKAVRDLLAGLLGRDVDVAVVEPFAPEPGRPATFAVYVDDALRARAVAVADLAFSAFSAAAIGLVPVRAARTAVERRALTPMLQENLAEVLDVCAALFTADGEPHVRLHAVYPVGVPAPSDVVAFAGVLGRRIDLETTIASYGVGRLSLVRLA